MKIRNRIEKELIEYGRNMEKDHSLKRISPLLFKYIREFISRKGKRVRPILFVMGYFGFSKKTAPGLYRSALSIELLHDFMLAHDDIIDKSDTRRGRRSMHKMFNDYLQNYNGAKFSGQDLTIVAGDVMFAIGIDTFLSIKERAERKERALKQLIRAALYTGSGEFIELLDGLKDLGKITREDIYKVYDYKTAYYTFSSPLAIGAILAGADKIDADKLLEYGIYLGRAFQIKDDMLGVFGDEKKIGKSTLTDLQEAKKTILIWFAYNHSGKKDKIIMSKMLTKEKVNRQNLKLMRKIILASGALDYAKKEVANSIKKAERVLESSAMREKYKSLLRKYSAEILAF